MPVLEVPIFPLSTVLFPEGRLPLRLFEQRYLDMAAECMKSDGPFGVCLIREGSEVGEPALPHAVGCLARIVEWDMPRLGLLHVMAAGGTRFRLLESRADRSHLLRGRIDTLPEPGEFPLPPAYEACADVLRRIIEAGDLQQLFAPLRYDSAVWVGYRLAELLPMAPEDKQALLEADSVHQRLSSLLDYLRREGLPG